MRVTTRQSTTHLPTTSSMVQTKNVLPSTSTSTSNDAATTSEMPTTTTQKSITLLPTTSSTVQTTTVLPSTSTSINNDAATTSEMPLATQSNTLLPTTYSTVQTTIVLPSVSTSTSNGAAICRMRRINTIPTPYWFVRDPSHLHMTQITSHSSKDQCWGRYSKKIIS